MRRRASRWPARPGPPHRLPTHRPPTDGPRARR